MRTTPRAALRFTASEVVTTWAGADFIHHRASGLRRIAKFMGHRITPTTVAMLLARTSCEGPSESPRAWLLARRTSRSAGSVA